MPKIIVVDDDKAVLENLEPQLFREFGDDADISVISSQTYMQKYFSVPRNADALIIAERMYSEELEKHNIANLFLLTDNSDDGSTGRLNENRLYEYASVQKIVNVVAGVLEKNGNQREQKTADAKTILVYSPVGGAGTTTVAIGLCATLYKNYKKCLYINTQSLQTFGSFFSNCVTLDYTLMDVFTDTQGNAVDKLKNMIRTELCDYLPPFETALSSVPVKAAHFIHLIQTIKAENTYDYIVLDGGSEFSYDVNQLMGTADENVIVYTPERSAKNKLNCLLEKIMIGPHTTLVCNQAIGRDDAGAENYGMKPIPIPLQHVSPATIQACTAIDAFQQLADAVM